MTRFNLFALLCLLGLLAAPGIVHAGQSYDNCTGTIASLPAVIITPGTWCLKQDLSTAITSGQAIIIGTNDVTIDCNGFKLGGLAAGIGTQTYGVGAIDRLNTTVRRCNIRGFFAGIRLQGSSGGGHLVEDNRFDGNTFEGMQIEGNGSVVRRNRVFDTLGSPLYPNAVGINSQYSVDIVDNTVSGVTATSGGNGFAFGISATGNVSGRIDGNGVRGLLKDGTGSAYGISTSNSGRITLHDNDLVGDGGVTGVGMDCSSTNARAKNNTISGFHIARAGCNDSGGNAVIP